MSAMKVLVKRWRAKGILCWVYLDDILVVSSREQKLRRDMEKVLGYLEDSGLQLNIKKSQLEPSQVVKHLGFQINFREGTLQVPTEKLRSIKKELEKFLRLEKISARKMSAILGQVRSFLTAIPALRSFTDDMLGFLRRNSHKGWDFLHFIPQSLKEEVLVIKGLLKDWQGRQMDGRVAVRTLHSDSSDLAWAGVDVGSNRVVQEWWRENKTLHINVKELSAAVQTAQAFARKGEKVLLKVDNAATYYYLKKGVAGYPISTPL
jgi:hypothetical protein